MKKNPLFYERNNANSFKIAFAKRKLFLSMALLFFVSFIVTASFANPSSVKGYAKTAGITLGSLAIVPLVPYKAGEQGDDESKEDFEARKGKGETPEAFTKRLMNAIVESKLKEFSKSDPEYKELKTLKESIANCIRKKDFEALAEKVGDMKIPNVEEIKEELKKQHLAIEALKESGNKGSGAKKGSIAETLIKNKKTIEDWVKSKSSKMLSIDHKAQTSTDIDGRDFYAQEHEPGMIGQIPVRKPFIRELFKNRPAGTEYIKYTDQETAVRDGNNVALCAANSTNNTKLTWKVRTVQITKVRDFLDICLDMMDDYLFVGGEIENLIDSSVKLKIDDQLLEGSGVNPELNSLISIAATWAANIAGIKDWTAQVTNANVVDLIVVAKSQIQELGKNNAWEPNYVLVNPGDETAMRLLKNQLGDSLRINLNLFVDNAGTMYISGMKVISNPKIDANTFLIGDFTKGTIYARPGYGIEFSYENNTNFETETVTVKAYERLNLVVRNVDKNAFMVVPDITTALATINKP